MIAKFVLIYNFVEARLFRVLGIVYTWYSSPIVYTQLFVFLCEIYHSYWDSRVVNTSSSTIWCKWLINCHTKKLKSFFTYPEVNIMPVLKGFCVSQVSERWGSSCLLPLSHSRQDLSYKSQCTKSKHTGTGRKQEHGMAVGSNLLK